MEEIKIEKKEVACDITEPSIELKDSYLAALDEFQKEGLNLHRDITEIASDFPKYIKYLEDDSKGLTGDPSRVPQTTYWIVDKDGYAGRVSIRHELNDKLLRWGGHIGYEVRPTKRRLGYGEKALRLALPKARAMGLKRVMISCDSTNIGSKKIIEANGGVLENEVPGEDGGPTKLRYWVDLEKI